jgi:outer membrane receptor protein involved in Fe transport
MLTNVMQTKSGRKFVQFMRSDTGKKIDKFLVRTTGWSLLVKTFSAMVGFPPMPVLTPLNVTKGEQYKPDFDNVAYNPVVQEQLTAYELGGRFEAAAFRYDYVNKQLRARIAVGPPFGNINAQDAIPKSRLKGFEASATVRPIAGLTLAASGTYIDSKILNYIGQTVDGVLQSQAGSPFNFTPKYSVNGDVNYERPVTSSLNAFAGVNVAYRGKTSAIFNPPGASQTNLAPFNIDKYTLVDGQIGVEAADGRCKAFLWGKNILNKYYWTNVVRVSDDIVRFPGMPATYGATVSFRLR